MNQHSPVIRDSELAASPLESFGGQRTSNEIFAGGRELRRFIAAHPGCPSDQMPGHLRKYLNFLIRRRLVTWSGNHDRRYFIRPL